MKGRRKNAVEINQNYKQYVKVIRVPQKPEEEQHDPDELLLLLEVRIAFYKRMYVPNGHVLKKKQWESPAFLDKYSTTKYFRFS